MPTKKSSTKKKPVIVRAYSGVFFGYEVARRGREIDLVDCRHVRTWDSAGTGTVILTANDIARAGVGSGSKLSGASPTATLMEVGAVFGCTAVAEKSLAGFP